MTAFDRKAIKINYVLFKPNNELVTFFMKKLIVIFLIAFMQFEIASAEQTIASFITASTSELDNPHDLKLSPDGKFLMVSDVGNNRIAILDPETLTLVTEFGSDHQSGTHDIDFDQQGRAYVADTHNSRVTIYAIEGTKATLIGELSEHIRGPEGVLAHPNGRIYVAGAWSNNVVAYKDGELAVELTGLSAPHDLEISPDGNIWLSDANNNRMLLLSEDLNILRELSGEPYDFNGVRYQDILPNGTIIAADKNNHTIKIIGSDGALLHVLGTGKAGKGPNIFRTPEGVEYKANTLWLSDSGNNRVVKYTINLD